MSEPDFVRGVVFTHGAMAQGLIDAVRRIAGDRAAGLIPLSNDGQSPESLTACLGELLGSGPGLIFTDLKAGSCGMTAMKGCDLGSGHAVIFGVNLPILLDFVYHRDLPLGELTQRLIEKGRDSVQLFNPSDRSG